MFADFFESLQRPDVKPKKWMKEVDLILGTKDNIKQAIDECLASSHYGIDLETTGLDNRVFHGRTRASIVYECTLKDAFPTTMNGIEFTDEQDGLVKLTVQLSYTNWTSK